MQKDNFNKDYNVYRDGEDYVIHTSFINLIFDIC